MRLMITALGATAVVELLPSTLDRLPDAVAVAGILLVVITAVYLAWSWNRRQWYVLRNPGTRQPRVIVLRKTDSPDA